MVDPAMVELADGYLLARGLQVTRVRLVTAHHPTDPKKGEARYTAVITKPVPTVEEK